MRVRERLRSLVRSCYGLSATRRGIVGLRKVAPITMFRVLLNC